MTFSTIQLEIDSGTATITLSRSDKRNAISYKLIEELLAALDEVKHFAQAWT
jgi:enoyl-CoA hydratase/carnithine racemase